MSDAVAGRRQRVLATMADRGIDALVLGRQDNTTWATGMHRLWTAGSRPFGAGCVLVADTGGVHLLSSWDDGIPDDVPFEHLYGVTWNPKNMAEAMAAIPGLAGATRIGVDALSPGFRRAAAGFAPGADLVAADDLLADLRRRKGDDEIEAIRSACAVARVGLDVVADELASGDADPSEAVEPDRLRAVALGALARAGGTVPSSGVVVEAGPFGATVDVGVLVDDWEGGLGRTLSTDGRVRGGRTEERVQALLAACRPGATGADLRSSGGDERWLVRGVGMGFERPVLGPVVGADTTVLAGDVLSIAVTGQERHHREVALVTDGQAELLT
jgi:Xaa-Pro aminopeptidase